MQPTVLGIAWFRRKHWKQLLEIFTDRDSLHSSYDEWLADAKKTERGMKALGFTVERIHIEPDRFPGWCAARGVEPNGEARSNFASEAIARKRGTRS